MRKIIAVVTVLLALSCTNENEVDWTSKTIDHNFNSSTTDWIGGFADYPEGVEEDWGFSVTHSPLPSPLDTTKKGVRISGSNHSDDLFMYLTRKVSMPKPDQLYKGTFEVEFATNAAEESVGVGGSPAHSIYVGIGLTSVEPKKVLDSTDGHYRMNISKIQQAGDGEDMKVIGDVSNGKPESEYTLVTRTGEFTGKTDADGNLWIIVGTDSGFEAVTTLYYTRIKVELQAVTE